MAEKMTKAQIIEALRDAVENDGYMKAPGTKAEIHERWAALKDGGYVHVKPGKFELTYRGRRALDEATHDR